MTQIIQKDEEIVRGLFSMDPNISISHENGRLFCATIRGYHIFKPQLPDNWQLEEIVILPDATNTQATKYFFKVTS